MQAARCCYTAALIAALAAGAVPAYVHAVPAAHALARALSMPTADEICGWASRPDGKRVLIKSH